MQFDEVLHEVLVISFHFATPLWMQRSTSTPVYQNMIRSTIQKTKKASIFLRMLFLTDLLLQLLDDLTGFVFRHASHFAKLSVAWEFACLIVVVNGFLFDDLVLVVSVCVCLTS